MPERAGQDASTTVTTSFNLYGNSVEPFDDTKQSALKTAVAQSAGHGVIADNVQISVDATYADQQKVLHRRLPDIPAVAALIPVCKVLPEFPGMGA